MEIIVYSIPNSFGYSPAFIKFFSLFRTRVHSFTPERFFDKSPVA